jgi:putative membrane protein
MVDETENWDGKLDPRIYLAAERTLLAWVRTGLALMGFGFVVARFGLFLREIAALPGALPHQHSGLSLWVGITLVILGVIVNLAAAAKHWRGLQRLERGQAMRFKPLSLEMAVAFMLGLLGLLMAAFLLFGLGRSG